VEAGSELLMPDRAHILQTLRYSAGELVYVKGRKPRLVLWLSSRFMHCKKPISLKGLQRVQSHARRIFGLTGVRVPGRPSDRAARVCVALHNRGRLGVVNGPWAPLTGRSVLTPTTDELISYSDPTL
jgi:hypothetical protein